MAYILTRPGWGTEALTIIKNNVGIPFFMNDQPRPSNSIVIRWGCRSEANGSAINKASAIAVAYNKGSLRKTLFENGLAMETYTDFMEWLRKGTEGKFIVRPIHHSRSTDMHVAEAPKDVLKAVDKIKGSGSDYYISKLIDKKHEYRVFVANNRIGWVIEKHPRNVGSVSWGCVTQGTFDYIPWSKWPIDVCNLALKSMKLTGLDFGAWDIIVGKDGSISALEVNTAPHVGPYYAKTIGLIFQWMVKTKTDGKDLDLPDVDGSSWKDIIHPALSS